jgi:hypothetical protein
MRATTPDRAGGGVKSRIAPAGPLPASGDGTSRRVGRDAAGPVRPETDTAPRFLRRGRELDRFPSADRFPRWVASAARARPPPVPDRLPVSPPSAPASLAWRFGVAWGFLVLSAVLGLVLRWQVFVPWPPLPYGHLLHAHSHVAFLGWVCNAFFVVALRHFLPPAAEPGLRRLWWVLQIAVLGMLGSFPWQGYGPVSIAFSTLHLVASMIFGYRLWRNTTAAPGVRFHLRAALVFLVLSAAGPLALGPLAAAGLREHPAYTLAIYWYLHCHYNGWFVFFLQALALERLAAAGAPPAPDAAGRAGGWLFAGGLLSFALSTLWCDPPPLVHVLAALGGLAQLVGCALFLRLLTGPESRRAVVRQPLLALVAGVFVLKPLLQVTAVVPGLTTLAHQRFVAIAFLHLVFLGFVLPALIAWADAAGWIRPGRVRRAGVALFLAGAALTEFLLVAPAAAGLVGATFFLPLAEGLLAGAAALVAGLTLLGAALRWR